MQGRAMFAVWAVLGAISGIEMSLAAWLLLAPNVGPPPLIPFQDKLFHLIAFGCLTGPAVLVLPKPYSWFWLAHMLALGAGIEWVQARMGEGRTADPVDFLADAIGIGLAFLVARLIRRRFETVPSVPEA